MPPTTSSAGPKDREGEEENLANAFMATSLGPSVGVVVTDERPAAVPAAAAPINTDHPPCDGCSKPFTGTMNCGRCKSAFYCGKDCQRAHWVAGHRAECKNEATARRVLSQFRENRIDWKSLEAPGAYKAAVRQGLHDKIREVLELDKLEIVRQLQTARLFYTYISYTQSVMMGLFRGHHETPGGEHLLDGLRVKGYVESHPDALEAWLQASVQPLRAVIDPATLQFGGYSAALFCATSVWRAWTYVFMNPTAARAILEPFPPPNMSGTGEDAGRGDEVESAEQRRKRGDDHARRIVKLLGEAIRIVESASGHPRFTCLPFKALQGTVMQVPAMVLVRSKECGIGVDVCQILDLKGDLQIIFRHAALEKAKLTIEKGAPLNDQETKAYTDQLSRKLGNRKLGETTLFEL